MVSENIMLLADSYIPSHHVQSPPEVKFTHSYFVPRGGKFNEVVFFGLQMLIKKYLEGQVVTQEKIDEADALYTAHLGPGVFNKAGWQLILDRYDGRLPIVIRALPEGAVVPIKSVVLTVENTDADFHWLPSYIETLLVQLWYPCTVATQSREMKKVIADALRVTGDESGLPFKLHDFGFRGVSSVESAGIGGLAHLVNFMGTDTVQALVDARRYYKTDMAGFSIPASEHATMTAWGQDRETEAYRNMLEKFKNSPLVAVVSDSYDIFNACENIWGGELLEVVKSRHEKGGGVVVIRPDSGDPETTVLKCLNILGEKFGFTVNDKGYKVLYNGVRLIQGDGMNYNSLGEILSAMIAEGWSADNIAFGMGGQLLQGLTRDDLSWAYKCSAVSQDQKDWTPVYKSPVGGSKASLKGRQALVKVPVQGAHGYGFVYENQTIVPELEQENELKIVFHNGILMRNDDLETIRGRAWPQQSEQQKGV